MSSAKMILAVLLLTLNFNLFVQEKLKVSIFYETYCPYCHHFILKNLSSTYNKIGSSLILDFVPYGNAKTIKQDGKYTFQCQHGADECKGNMLVNCISTRGKKKCASDANVDFPAIKQCMDSDLGSKLLAKYGERTDAYPIDGVPFIMYNDHFNETLCNWARKDFLEATCSLFETKPDACPEKFKPYSE